MFQFSCVSDRSVNSLTAMRLSISIRLLLVLVLSFVICISICLSTCLCVCLRAYLKDRMPKLYKISVCVTCCHSSVLWQQWTITTRYVFPVLWMMSCFHIMGQVQIQACSLWCSKLFTVTRQVVPLNCAPGSKVCYRWLPCSCCYYLELLGEYFDCPNECEHVWNKKK